MVDQSSGAKPPTVCPNCGSTELEVYGSRTSTHDRGYYAGWTTTTGRFGCTACAAVTTVTTRVPADSAPDGPRRTPPTSTGPPP